MINNIKNRLEMVINLTNATPPQTQEIFSLYKQLLNPQFFGCATCPASVRQAHSNIKEYYINNYGNKKR